MLNAHSLIGLILALYVLVTVMKGRVTVSDGDRYSRGVSKDWISRSTQPVQFWFFVILLLALAAALFFNIFNLPF